MRRAAVISIDVEAGTAKMLAQLQQAKAGLREFGASGASSMAPTTVALRELSGNLENNTRGVARFLAQTLGLGPVLQAAFPLIGGIAFGGMIVSLGGKVVDFFKKMAEAPEKSNHAFYSLSASLRTVNDDLELANAKLANDIAQLEGKRKNNLEVALLDAKVAADKLGDSLNKDIAALYKLLQEQSTSVFTRMFQGGSDNKQLQKYFGGESGVGGMQARLDELNEQEAGELAKVTDKTPNAKAVVAAIRERYTGLILKELADGKAQIQKAYQDVVSPPRTTAGIESAGIAAAARAGIPGGKTPGELADVEKLKHDLTAYDEVVKHYQTLRANLALVGKKDEDEIAHANAGLTRPIQNKIDELKAQLKGIQEISAAVGRTEGQQVAAKATAEYEKAIAELDKALKDHKGVLTDLDKAQIKSLETQIAQAEANKTSATHFDEVTKGIQEQITAHRELAAAVGASYEATRNAYVQTQLAKDLKEHQGDTAWMNQWAGNIEGLRQLHGTEFDTQHGEETAKNLQSLTDQISLETQLSVVITQGVEAVHRAEMAEKAVELSRTHTKEETQALLDKEERLYQLRRLTASNKAAGNLQAQAEGEQRLGTAAFGGADALRIQERLNVYIQMAREGATQEQIRAQAALDFEKHEAAINEEAAKLVTVYNDQVAHLNDLTAALERQRKDHGDTLEIEIALRDLENERLKLAVQQELKLRGAKDGLKAFFLEMQEQAESAGDIVYHALHSALDRLSDDFGKLFTGQIKKGDIGKTFGKTFEGIGESMVSSSIKSIAQHGLGALGEKLGIHPEGKAAQHVVVDNWPAAPSGISGKDPFAGLGANGNPLPGVAQSSSGIGGFLRKIFSSPTSTGTPDLGGPVQSAAGAGFPRNGNAAGAGAAAIAPNVPPAGGSPIFGGVLASGGEVSPGVTYWAGDVPEFFTPKTAGTVTPLSKLAQLTGPQHVTVDNFPAGERPTILQSLREPSTMKPAPAPGMLAGPQQRFDRLSDLQAHFQKLHPGATVPSGYSRQSNTQLAGKTSETTKPAPAFPGADHLPVGLNARDLNVGGRDDQLSVLQAHFQKLYPGATAPSGIPGYSRPSAIPRFAEGGIITEPTVGLLGDQGDEAVIPLQGTGANVFSRLLQRFTSTGQKSFSKIFEGAGEDAINETVSSGHGTHRPIHAIVDNWPASLSGDRGGAVNAGGNPLAAIGTSPGTPVSDLRTVGLAAITAPNPAAGSTNGPAANPAPWYASLAKIFGGSTAAAGSTGPSAPAIPSFAFASDFGGFLAEGGDVDPGKVYGVAEAGEAELFMPRSSGSVTPLSQLGGGDTYHTWQIDARGADLGVANRLDEIMNGVHDSAVVKAIRANAEMAKRRPRMS